MPRQGASLRSIAPTQLSRHLACAACALAAALLAADVSGAAATAAIVAGTVADAAGHPIPGARASVLGEGEQALGGAITGSAGRFEIALQPARLPPVRVRVEAEGFETWESSPEAGRLRSLRIVPDRRVDRAFLDRLLATSDANARRDAVREMLAVGGEHWAYEPVFPFLGALRKDLREVVRRAPAAARTEKDLEDRAQELLALWGDPADALLVRPWIEKNPSCGGGAAAGRGAPLPAACQAWTAVHFQAEHAPQPWTWHLCGEPVVDAAGTRALVKFDVRYARWQYELYLVFDRQETSWTLRTVVQGWIT